MFFDVHLLFHPYNHEGDIIIDFGYSQEQCTYTDLCGSPETVPLRSSKLWPVAVPNFGHDGT